MSMDNPNEYEEAIEAYAVAVRRQDAAERALIAAQREMENSRDDRQLKWRKVSAYVNKGLIKTGFYRLKSGPSEWADGILIEEHHDYPRIFREYR